MIFYSKQRSTDQHTFSDFEIDENRSVFAEPLTRRVDLKRYQRFDLSMRIFGQQRVRPGVGEFGVRNFQLVTIPVGNARELGVVSVILRLWTTSHRL